MPRTTICRCGNTFTPWFNENGGQLAHPRQACGRCVSPAILQSLLAEQQRKIERAVIIKKVCPWCEETFETMSTQQIYCCDQHQNVAKSVRRKARLRDVGGVRLSAFALWRRDRGRCGLCGKAIGREYKWPDKRSMSVDHMVPTDKRHGGRDEASNQQAAHLGCNLRKGTRVCGSQLRLFG